MDDRKENILALNSLIDSFDIEIFEALSGKEAIELVHKHEFALIYLDVNMPEMDGYDTLRYIRHTPQGLHTPVIFVTAASIGDVDPLEGYSSGAVDFILKPLSPAVVRAKTSVFLNMYLEKEKVRRLIIELESKNNDLDQFNHLISHDLREPLRTIHSYLGVIKEDYCAGLDDKAVEYINVCRKAVQRLQSMITELLSYAKVKYGDKPLKIVDLNNLLTAVQLNISGLIKEAGCKIQVSSLPSICANSVLLTQVFQNLIQNAIQYSKEGLAPYIVIEGKIEGELLHMTFTDNGIGIQPIFAERVFLIFKRLQDKANISGTGIGLAFVKKIIDLHHGEVWIDKEYSDGTCIHITLPINLQHLQE